HAAPKQQHPGDAVLVHDAGPRPRPVGYGISIPRDRRRRRLDSGGTIMKRGLPILLGVVTAVLIVMGWLQSGAMGRREMRSASTPEQAVRLMLSQIQGHNFDAAYARLANRSDVDKNSFVREFNGSYGSLLTYASLESFEVWGLHTGDQEAAVRAKFHYSTA